jgi:hypothetical protein
MTMCIHQDEENERRKLIIKNSEIASAENRRLAMTYLFRSIHEI